eukprot:5372276-Alexandrium_andersonii.AAC.1
MTSRASRRSSRNTLDSPTSSSTSRRRWWSHSSARAAWRALWRRRATRPLLRVTCASRVRP